MGDFPDPPSSAEKDPLYEMFRNFTHYGRYGKRLGTSPILKSMESDGATLPL